jgi:hypothetical protein
MNLKLTFLYGKTTRFAVILSTLKQISELTNTIGFPTSSHEREQDLIPILELIKQNQDATSLHETVASSRLIELTEEYVDWVTNVLERQKIRLSEMMTQVQNIIEEIYQIQDYLSVRKVLLEPDVSRIDEVC